MADICSLIKYFIRSANKRKALIYEKIQFRKQMTVYEHNTRISKTVEYDSILSFIFSAGGPRLKCNELLKHVIEVLQSSYCCSAYGEDYSSLLVKDILSIRKYWCDISSQQWQSQWAVDLDIDI